MQIQTNSFLSIILTQRESYLNTLGRDLANYGPDVQAQVHGYLPKIGILEPCLHQTVSLLYEKMRLSSRNDAPNKLEDFQLYKKIKESLTRYIQSKQENAKLDKLICFDIWSKVFPEAKDEQAAKRVLKASDHVEDLLWLVEVASEHKLPEDDVHLSSEIDNLLAKLPAYFSIIPVNTDAQRDMQKLWEEIKCHYLDKDYSKTIEKADELKKYIRI